MPERAATLARARSARAAVGDAGGRSRDADGLVHATPTGMDGHPGIAARPGAAARRDLWVADVVYRPLETELLRDARERGCRTLDGGGMVVLQAAGSFELFTGLRPDRERMLRHFAELTPRRREATLDRHRLPERHARGEARRPRRAPASTASSCSSPT